MSGNTESTSNSIKFAPMPMSALLANLMPFKNAEQSPDASMSSGDETDNSFGETVSKKPSPAKKINKDFFTPTVKPKPKDIKAFASEKKFIYNEHDKENNLHDCWAPHQTHPAKENHNNIIQNAHKSISSNAYPNSDAKSDVYTNSEAKKRSVLMQQNNSNMRSQSSCIKKTPEVVKVQNSSQKLKSATPKIKSGIRRFTPGSKQSQKKTPQKAVIQNRDRVRVELFTQNPSKDEPQCPPPRAEPAPVPVPETPLNKKAMPASYVATPSYPQGAVNNNLKKLFKTTIIKDKRYMFIKKLGVGGSSEVYKVSQICHTPAFILIYQHAACLILPKSLKK